jgi:hypothetical protein
MLPQAKLTLNLFQPTAAANATSALEVLFGKYNFDATPLGPAGCRVLIHAKPTVWQTWDFRMRDGYYIGLTLAHHRCYRVLNKTTRAVGISDAVKFRPHKTLVPMPTMNDRLLHALHCIECTLANTTMAPSTIQIQVLHTIRDILLAQAPSTQPEPTNIPTIHPPPGVPRNSSRLPAPAPSTTPPVQSEEGWTLVQHTHQQAECPPAPITMRS